jgi:hypothetical protein
VQAANERFEKLVSRLNIVEVDSHLAYYAAPMRYSQQFLYPVYVYQAVAEFDKEKVPMRLITLPATEFGPTPKPAKPAPIRDRQFFAPPKKTYAIDSADLNKATPAMKLGLRAFPSYEAGTSWIGLSGGLSGSQNNAKGFVDELADAGWKVNFNWGHGSVAGAPHSPNVKVCMWTTT